MAQQNPLVSGPWAGNVQMRTAVIWAEVAPSVKMVAVEFVEKNNPINKKIVAYKGALGLDFNPVKIYLNGLKFNTTYTYTIIIDGKKINVPFATQFTTQDLWQWRKPAPDFSFLAGSCAYFNEPIYDRPGKPYGDTDGIFYTMANTAAAFHVWMGDNWYTREVDYNDAWGLNYRASHDRAQKALQPFMASMPQYAIWDDHDYGPNDAGKSYILKNESRNVFKNYMLNPSYGEDEKGIYTKISYSDVDIFLTDDRFFRSEDEMPDSVNGQPSPQKHFFGAAQMEWLQNQLSFSNATFKIIVVGSQVLNPLDKAESMQRYPYEYQQLLQFITNQKINGVLFFTGDRHHSEVVKMERPQQYPLYDVTISPYTSGVSKVTGVEKNSPYRVANTLVEAQNFGKISVSGAKNKRTLKVDFVGVKGAVLGTWSVNESELKAN
ncbi:alkaline phosphatase D family protein [Ferruginibacter yonginensis]|uniref:Alkaline phosphatase D family protein n=1 Tax=Ferruginibacter yonginensis TaxID=1310416 RepID=A0ABV8QQF0_9BACT